MNSFFSAQNWLDAINYEQHANQKQNWGQTVRVNDLEGTAERELEGV